MLVIGHHVWFSLSIPQLNVPIKLAGYDTSIFAVKKFQFQIQCLLIHLRWGYLVSSYILLEVVYMLKLPIPKSYMHASWVWEMMMEICYAGHSSFHCYYLKWINNFLHCWKIVRVPSRLYNKWILIYIICFIVQTCNDFKFWLFW